MITRLRLAAVAVLGSVACAAVAGLAYASTSGPASAQQYQYPRKVTICHHTGSKKNPHRTITVSRNALPAHLRHGDAPVPCTNGNAVRNHSNAAHVKKFHKNTTLRAELRAEKNKAKGKGKGKGPRP